MANVTGLYLDGNNITDDGFATLFPLLKKDGKLSGLTQFSIGSGVTDKGMREFSDLLAMGAMPGLLTLELFNNKIGDDGMKALSSALAGGALPALQSLFIDRLSEELRAHCSSKSIKLNF